MSEDQRKSQVIEFAKQQLDPNMTLLYISEVGSKMWGMDHANSDHDMVVIYQVSSRDILSGRSYKANLPAKHHVYLNSILYDFQFMEIGHFINLLLKVNINAVWALFSPLVYYKDAVLQITGIQDLIEYWTSSSLIIPSAVGMTLSQLADMEKRSEMRDPLKSLLCAYRTAKFAHNFVTTGQIWFEKPPNKPSPHLRADIEKMLEYLQGYKDSLPIETAEDFLRVILYQLRIQDFDKQ